MVSKEDIELTYDYTPFLKAVNKMSGSFDDFSKNMNKQSAKTEKVSTQKNKTTGKGFMKLAFLAGLVVAGVMLIKKAIQSIPEIGKTFAIAGGIIKRNLLWPLRKELIPYLQKMLDWVRDHRSMFVKWGVAIGKVFKVIKAVFMLGVKIVSTFVGAFKNAIKDLFDISAKNISKVFNLLIFKIITLIMLLEIKLRPLAKILGKIFAEIVKVIWNFVSSFGKAMAKVLRDMGAIGKIKSIWKSIDDIFKRMNISMGAIKNLGNILGKILGVTIVGALEIIAGIFQTIKNTIESIISLVKIVKGEMKWSDFGKILETQRQNKPDEDIFGLLPEKKSVINDSSGIVNKKEIANNVNVLMDVKLNVTEGSAKEAGENFTSGIENKITDILMNSTVSEGSK